MAHDHPAFFGDDDPSDLPPGIPADLAPYLEEADLPSQEQEAQAEQARAEAAQAEADQAERTAALRRLVENSLLAGPDPSIVSELEGGDWDDAEDTDPQDGPAASPSSHEDALDGAERDLALDQRVRQITRDILARAPEHRVQPSLERVEQALDLLGDPEDTYPSIHLTGTNGKTSTARMIDAVLTALGMRVGRFTSPHLVDIRERISVEGQPITPEGFIAAWEDVAPYIDLVDQRSIAAGGPRMSFFEVLTVMAFAAFADHPVDAAVVEVGMGGVWDATNTMDGDVAVILPIDLDHQQWLGSTIEQIATEKAGIIKARQTVVIARQPPAALEILLARARAVDAVVRLEDRDFEVLDDQRGVGGQMVTIRTPTAIYQDVFVPLLGEHQAHNAAAALVAVEAFLGGRELDGRIVEHGFMTATSPGRLEVVRTSPTIIVDAAHNPAGARSLRTALDQGVFDFAHIVGLFSAMRDKDVEGVLGEMEPVLDDLVVTTMPGERAMSADQLMAVATDVFGEDRVELHEDLAEAVDRAVELAEAHSAPGQGAGVVAFGSVVLAGEVSTSVRAVR